MTSSISSAVLRFRTYGITHVVMFDQQGRIATYFIPQAESQQYKPRYGFTSQAGFQVGVTSGGIPKDQAAGAAGIGWLPVFDVPMDPKTFSPGAKRCAAFFASKGMPASGENATVIQQFQCQDAWLLKAVMDQLSTDVTSDAFISVVDGGSGYLAAANLGQLGFAPRHHDGATVVRDVAWNAACSCFRYVGRDHVVR
jgi:hypothetical protein